MSKLWWLSSTCLYQCLEMSEMNSLLSLMETAHYEKSQTVYSSQLPGDALYVIQKGKVQVIYKTEMGSERVLTELRSGDVFGSLELIDSGYEQTRVTTRSSAHMLVLRKKRFEQLLTHHPHVSGKLIDGLRSQLKPKEALSSELYQNALMRYRRLLQHTQDSSYTYQANDISHLLGVSLEEAEQLLSLSV